jgi:hypothetical protein
MVKFTIPTHESNPLIENGSIEQKMETLLGKLQPEAAYFCPIDGKRSEFFVVNLEEESQTVTKPKTLWLGLAATVETFPVATADELIGASKACKRLKESCAQTPGQVKVTAVSHRGGQRFFVPAR